MLGMLKTCTEVNPTGLKHSDHLLSFSSRSCQHWLIGEVREKGEMPYVACAHDNVLVHVHVCGVCMCVSMYACVCECACVCACACECVYILEGTGCVITLISLTSILYKSCANNVYEYTSE